MATGLGTRAQKEAFNHLFGKVPDTTPAGVMFVALHALDPADDGQSGTEETIGTNGYARVAVVAADWNPATDANPSVVDNANAITFPTVITAAWASGSNFTHFSLWTSAAGLTEADYVGRGVLTSPQPANVGQTPNFPAGQLSMDINETP